MAHCIAQWLQERLTGNTAAVAAPGGGGSTSQHSSRQASKPSVDPRQAPTLHLLPLDLPPLQLQQQGPRRLQLPSEPPACRSVCSSSSSTKPSRLRQSITQAASKLSCKTVVDLNSGLCSTELAWHVRAQQQQQQPARMAVKVSNRHKTRVTFDAQVALRNTAGAVLRLAGSPQGMHAASLLIKPAATAQGGSPSTPADAAPTHDAESAASDMRHGQSSSSSSDALHNSQAAPSSSSSSNATTQQSRRRRHPRQRGHAGSSSFAPSPNTLSQPDASSSSHQHHTGAPAGIQRQLAGSTAVPAQVQWEVGWNWKAGGPIASVTKQLSDSTTAASSSTGGTVSTSWRAVQQLKLAFDPNGQSYTLAAGGEGWNVILAVPTRDIGLGALVPRVCKAGCRPKLTLSLVPDVCCF